jgi:EAL and modified HD-GYP domain-containing signal transduction protein
MKPKKSDNDLKPVTFARLPIFDDKKNLWGYELVYYFSNGKQASGGEITPDLMYGTALALEQTMDREKNILVNFSRQNLLDDLPYTLPPGRTTIKITDPGGLTDPHVQALSRLQKAGYRMTVAWVKDHGAFPMVFDQTDMICLDISNRVLPDLTDICCTATSHGSMMLAQGVDNQTKFNICSRAGFAFFQGSFFKQPEDISVKKVLSGTISKFKLMEAIEQKDPDFSTLAATIQADVAISFRLLAYLNSASFGVRRKVDSIKDAITLLGWDNLKTWLRVVLLAEVSENRHAPELIFLSAQRGKFLEQIGLTHDFWGFEPDSLFLLGMFSLLDALLNQPMAEIVRYLPLADKLKGALCMADNNEYVPVLKLARYFEEAAFEQSNTMINQLGLDTVKTRQAYCDAMDFANQLGQL